jgi:outer membrane protein OmpA-like peptidoglycan-associated protein
MMNPYRCSAVCIALAVLTGCGSMPPANARLEEARRDYHSAQADPTTRDRAAVELRAAGEAVRLAGASWDREDSVAEVDHWAYLARQRVAIARETGLRREGEQASKEALSGRDQVRLAARTNEADQAQRSAEFARQSAELSRRQTQAAQRETMDAQARSAELESQWRELNARRTERGMTLTLDDMLFATDAARLTPQGLQSLDRLAQFLKRHPQRTAMIEGFTDSTGSADHNQALSDRRADAVRQAVVERGIEGARLETHGYGEAHPVADNDSASGRQMNRRVEIILSDAAGAVPRR